jgi:hypothetical protein
MMTKQYDPTRIYESNSVCDERVEAAVAAMRQACSDAVLENHFIWGSCKCDSKVIEALPGGDHALRLALARAVLREAEWWHDIDSAFGHGPECKCIWCNRVRFLRDAVTAIKMEKP